MNILTRITAYAQGFRGLRYGETLRPARDWMILLVCAGIVLLAILAWNVWFFFEVLTGGSSGAPLSEETTVNTAVIEEAKTLFDARAAEEARFRNEYQFIDPSR